MGSMGTKLLLLLLLWNIAGYASQTKTLVIYFGKDKDYITNGEAEKLQVLKSADYVMLTGHTDNDGNDSFNMDLSKRRVNKVKAFIQYLNKDIKIETNYFGETKPLNQNANEEEKTMNRRVEISYVSDPLLSIAVPVNDYKIDNTKEQTITCPHGTQVIVPAGAFNNKQVNIHVSEYYNPDEIFAANLTTSSNQTPLETAGMIYITADSNGVAVEPLKALQFKFPNQNKNKGYKIFSGVRDSSLNMNWVLNTTVKKESQQSGGANSQSLAGSKIYDTFPMRISNSYYAYCETAYTRNWDNSGVQYFYGKLYALVENTNDTNLRKLTVDINFKPSGQIASVKDNYVNNDKAAFESVRKSIYACLPPEFKAYSIAPHIHIGFYKGTQSAYKNFRDLMFWCGKGEIFSGIPKYEADAIVLSSSTLGWINCDRLLTGPKLQAYNVETDSDASLRLVLKKYKSFFGAERSVDLRTPTGEVTSRTFIFYNIPDNEDVVLISTKKVDGILYLAIENAKTSKRGNEIDFNYKAVSKEELAEAIKTLKI